MSERGCSPSDDRTKTGGEAADATRCATCGARIDSTAWHPVATQFDDGEFTLHAFCSVDCREEWNRAKE